MEYLAQVAQSDRAAARNGIAYNCHQRLRGVASLIPLTAGWRSESSLVRKWDNMYIKSIEKMTINPFKLYRQWRTHREAGKDALLRLKSIDMSTRFGDPLKVNLYRAHIIFLYVKYGIAEDGVSVDALFDKNDFSNFEEKKYRYPDKPIKL